MAGGYLWPSPIPQGFGGQTYVPTGGSRHPVFALSYMATDAPVAPSEGDKAIYPMIANVGTMMLRK